MATSKNQRVMCFDPGLTCCGWSVLDFSDKHSNIVVTRFGSIKPSPTVSKVAWRDEVLQFSKRTVSLALLKTEVTALLETYKPDHIAVEGAFFNPRMPTAFAALTQWLCVVDMLCYDKFRMITHKVPPKSAKSSIAVGTSGKVSVMQAVLNNKSISFKQKKQVALLSEHESDSVAVGYHFIMEIYPTLLVGDTP